MFLCTQKRNQSRSERRCFHTIHKPRSWLVGEAQDQDEYLVPTEQHDP